MQKQILFVSLFALTACGQKTQQHSDTSALVTQQQANTAFAIVKAIDYLPFTYIIDGCYARSLYMSMELAANKIPSSAHYVNGYLQPTADVSWGYHVAPLLQLQGSSQEPWILDPAFEKEPLTRKQWVAKNYAESGQSLDAIVENTTTEIRAGSAYFTRSSAYRPYDVPTSTLFTAVRNRSGDITSLKWAKVDSNKLIPDFARMPAFTKSDIQHACSVMYSYIANERNVDVEAKQIALLNKTTSLTKAMKNVSKLNNNGFHDPADSETQAEQDALQSCLDAIELGVPSSRR